MLHYRLLLLRGPVALQRFHLYRKCARQLVVRALGAVPLLKAFGVGEAICGPHSRNVRRSRLGCEHCVDVISGFPIPDEREHEFEPQFVRMFALGARISDLMNKAEKEIRIPSAEAAHKGTRFAHNGNVGNVPALAHREVRRPIGGLVGERRVGGSLVDILAHVLVS